MVWLAVRWFAWIFIYVAAIGFAAGSGRSAPETSDRRSSSFASGPAIVLYLAAAKLFFHLLTANRYGISGDELYYLACAGHLAWGYVDQPPLIALLVWFARHVLGDSLLGLRLLPAIAGATLVWLTGRITREVGGGRFAQALAALAVAVVPAYMILQHWMRMNAFEPIIWTACAWCVVRAINSGQPRYWLGFGALAGVGMENKYSVAFFVLSVLIGLAATPERRLLTSRWLWAGGLAGFLIFLPNLIWLFRHHFPFLELMHNVHTYGGVTWFVDLLAFIQDQAIVLNPALLPLWVGGLAWLLFGRGGTHYRGLALAYLVMLAVFTVLGGKDYYLAPAYPMLLAAGAVSFERATRDRRAWSRSAYVALTVGAGALAALLSAPILPVDTYVRMTRPAGATQGGEFDADPLPLYFSDEFGWEDMTREVARVYNSLPPDQRFRTAILAKDYSEAGAIDFFGPKYGLPKAICPHQNYWLWGPRNYSGDMIIMLGSDFNESYFRSVEIVGHVDGRYSRRDEHFDIFLCRGLKWPLPEVWPKMKHWS
ncbi:MAG TPA: glycosyltransferase family 39 protein [Terriglobia bacterium]